MTEHLTYLEHEVVADHLTAAAKAIRDCFHDSALPAIEVDVARRSVEWAAQLVDQRAANHKRAAKDMRANGGRR